MAKMPMPAQAMMDPSMMGMSLPPGLSGSVSPTATDAPPTKAKKSKSRKGRKASKAGASKSDKALMNKMTKVGY